MAFTCIRGTGTLTNQGGYKCIAWLFLSSLTL